MPKTIRDITIKQVKLSIISLTKKLIHEKSKVLVGVK